MKKRVPVDFGAHDNATARVLRYWMDERDSAALYLALAALERNPRLSRVFGKLAASEREHCAFWEKRLHSQGRSVPEFRPSLRTRILIALARRFGVAFVIPSITVRELADRDRYSTQEDATAAGLATEERAHAAVMRTIGSHSPSAGDDDASGIGRSANLANNLRAAILGANDGLTSNFCLLMGVAGGGARTSMILLTGVAGLFAGACAMALGEWLSVTNTREMANSQIDKEVEQLWAEPERRREELALIYEARGLSEDEAKRAVDRITTADPDTVAALTREEVGINPADLGVSPSSAAVVSFALFALGAVVPLLPFFFLTATPGIIASTAVSVVALFVLGLATSFFNSRSPLFSGLRQVGFGVVAAGTTYGIGRLFAAAIS
jgi:VIT1/CCC1 family predicted Fe2+/Mn2+ transporter